MNTPSGGFYQIDNEVIDKHIPSIGVYGLAVYSAIVRFANKNSSAFPSYQTLATTLGISRRKVIDSMNALVDAGLIEKTKRVSDSGDPTSNLYTLVNLRGSACHALPSKPSVDQVHDMHYGSEQDALGVVHVMHPNNTQLEQDLPEQHEGEKDLDGINATDQSPAPEPVAPAASRQVNAFGRPIDGPGILLDDLPSGPKTLPPDPPPQSRGVNVGIANPGQLVREGTGKDAYWVFREYFPRTLTEHQMTCICSSVSDIPKWRKVCERWAEVYGNDWYKFGLLDWYRDGIPGNGAASAKSKTSLQHKNGARAHESAASNPLYAQFG